MALAVLAACGSGGSEKIVGVESTEARARALAVVSGSGVYVYASSRKDTNSGSQRKPIKTQGKLATFQLTASQNNYLSRISLLREAFGPTPLMLDAG